VQHQASLDQKLLADYLRKNEMKTIVGPIRLGKVADQTADLRRDDGHHSIVHRA
jgi:hypothetical protein